MRNGLVATVGILLWLINALFVCLAVVNVAVRTPEHLGAGIGIGIVMAFTLILGGWVMLRSWRGRHLTGALKFGGLIVGLLWAVPAAYGIFLNADGFYLSAVPFLFGVFVLKASLRSSTA